MRLRISWLLFLLFCATALQAQDAAQLSGLITDQSGAVVAKVEIHLVRHDTGALRTILSNEDGLYLLSGLQPAVYDLEVRKDGFQPQIRTGLTMNAGQRSRIDFVLKVGSDATTVSVSADAGVMETSGTLQSTTSRAQLNELPLNGRNAATLVELSPGIGSGGKGDSSQISTYPNAEAVSSNGGRTDGVSYYLDGGLNSDPFTNVSNPFPNPDALEEFSVQTNNFSAENGRATGAVVNVITRSGTNAYHGSAFEYMRNSALNAQNYFSTTKDSLSRNQFGGSLGGPIRKDKLFYFGSYQGTYINTANTTGSAYTLTKEQREGDFSSWLTGSNPTYIYYPGHAGEAGYELPGNSVKGYISSVTKNLLNYIPTATDASGLVYYTIPATHEHENQGMGRIDYRPNDRHRLYLRYFRTGYVEDPIMSGTNLLAASHGANFMNQVASGSYTATPTAHLTNTAVFSFSQTDANIVSAAEFSAADLGSNVAHSDPPGLKVTVLGYFSFNTREPGEFNRYNYQMSDVLHWSLGRHEFSFGGDYLRMNVDINNHYGQNGGFYFYPSFTGNSLSDLMIGMMAGFQQGGGEYAQRRGNLGGAFAQDDMRLSRRLSVNAGVRWDPYAPYSDTKGRTLCWAPGKQSTRFTNAPEGVLYAGDKGCPAGGSTSSIWQFNPRLGLSYALDEKTVLRAGAGLFYQPPFVESFNNMVDTAPFSQQELIYATSFADPYGYAGVTNPFPDAFAPKTPAADVAFSLPMTTVSFQHDWKPARVASWNLTLEHAWTQLLSMRVAYVGTQASHLSFNDDLNAPVYESGASESNIQARRSYQNFSTVIQNVSGGTSSYNALQASIAQRPWHGMQYSANYTWSRSLDWNSYTTDLDGVSVINPFKPSAYRGVSDFNVPHRFVINGMWKLPSPVAGWQRRVLGDWTVSGIWNWQSGDTLNITSGDDNSMTGIGNDQADQISKPHYTSGNKQARMKEWFTTDAFAVNAVGTFGTTGRNTLIGPSKINVDLGVSKSVIVHGKFALNLRADAFNAFNHAPLGDPGTTVDSGGFGTITSAGDPRIMQLAVKFTF